MQNHKQPATPAWSQTRLPTQRQTADLRSDVVLRVPLVTGPLHREVPIEVLHLALLLDKVLANAVERHDQRVPILAVDLLLKGELVPLEVPVLALMAVLNGDGGSCSTSL